MKVSGPVKDVLRGKYSGNKGRVNIKFGNSQGRLNVNFNDNQGRLNTEFSNQGRLDAEFNNKQGNLNGEFGSIEINNGIDTSDATATSADLLDGKTAYANDEKITGAILTYDGDFSGGVDISGINTSDATATEKDILKGKSAYANNEKVVGSIPTYSGANSEGFTIDGADLEIYNGEHSVTPKIEEKVTLGTAKKILKANIVVEKIPITRVTNTSGGNTVIIGG